MRALTALLAWLSTTVLLTVAVPTAWVQHNLVDDDGFAALSARAAQRPALQAAVAAELAAQEARLIRARGTDVDDAQVRGIASAYTAGPAFPPRFARAMQTVHRGLFTADGAWVVDLAPMLGDSVFASTTGYGQDPWAPTEPPAVAAPESLRAGQLGVLAAWADRISLAAVVLTGGCALLTVVAARRRGRAVTGLGVSALLAGAAGWAGVEVVRGYLDGALASTAGVGEVIADAMVATAVDSLHHWLNLTLAAGAVLVVLGVAVATAGGLRRT